MALVTIDAVVDISRHVVVLEVIRVVAAVTSRALEDRVVIGIDVARRAHPASVAVTGRELGVLRMVERGAGPGCRVVAVLAGGGEELRLRRVAGVCGVVVVGLMAADAGRGQRRVVVVDVAVRAGARRHSVRTSQGEGCVAVIKRRISPDIGVVAQLARRRKSRGRVCRIISAGVVLLMA